MKIKPIDVLLPTFFGVAFVVFTMWFLDENLSQTLILNLTYCFLTLFACVLAYLNLLEKSNNSSKLAFGSLFTLSVSVVFEVLNHYHNLFSSQIIELLIFISKLSFFYGMLYSNQKTSLKRGDSVFICMIMFFAFVNYVALGMNDFRLNKVLTVLIFLLFIGYYIIESKYKIKSWVVINFILVLIAESLYVLRPDLKMIIGLLSIFQQIILIYMIYKFNYFNKNFTLKFFTIILISYGVLHFGALKVEKAIIYLCFSVVNALLTAIALSNYISKMYLANYLLWLGVAFGVLNYSIISIYHQNYDSNIYSFSTNIVSHFLIVRSFIIRERNIMII